MYFFFISSVAFFLGGDAYIYVLHSYISGHISAEAGVLYLSFFSRTIYPTGISGTDLSVVLVTFLSYPACAREHARAGILSFAQPSQHFFR